MLKQDLGQEKAQNKPLKEHVNFIENWNTKKGAKANSLESQIVA